MITPITPAAARSATAATCAAEPIPPDNSTGRPAARATAQVRVRSGPARVPSRAMLVYTMPRTG